jgi:poly(3-hydroxybutyrate) depolymerase
MVKDAVPAGDDKLKPSQTPASDGALTGANHPLAQQVDARMSQAGDKSVVAPTPAPGPTGYLNDFSTAREVVTDASGQTTERPINGQLAPGDHTLQFENGRQFVVHVPQNDGKTEMPVMFVIAPSVHTNQGYDAKNFEYETGMNQYADKDKFIVVYADDANHLLGKSSQQKAEAWNAPGTGINDGDLKLAGYNDENYINSIAAMMPQLANVDSSHKDWGALAFSQGGMFLNELQHSNPNLFPTVGLVGSTFQDGYDYSTAAGNSANVMLVNLHGDGVTLPFPNEESGQYRLEKAAAEALNDATDPRDIFSSRLPDGEGTKIAERKDPLGGIDNREQNPQRQEDFYIHAIQLTGNVNEQVQELPTPVASAMKDAVTSYTVPGSDHKLSVVDLATAQHSYPGPDNGLHVNSTPQYVEFDTSKFFAEQFVEYNAAEKNKKHD